MAGMEKEEENILDWGGGVRIERIDASWKPCII